MDFFSNDVFDAPALHNLNIEADTDFGLHPCSLTGKFSDDGLFAEIILPPALTMYARILNPANFFGGVNEDFITKFPDSLIGYVAFERGLPEKPLLIAFALTSASNNKIPDELVNINHVVAMMTGKQKLVLDETAETANLIFSSGTATIGDINSARANTLSDVLIQRLNELSDKVSELANAVSKSKVLVVGTSGVISPDDIVSISKVALEISQLKTTFADIKSKKVFIS